MPFFRAAGKFCFYAHVPKCGGTSVEDYLIERFGPIAFLDRRFQSYPEKTRWSRTSPQHVDWESLRPMVPPEWIEAVFAVVRHPVARIESAYHFQRDVEGTVAPETGFTEWLEGQVALMTADPFALDNHVRPQADFVPEGAAIFHLEHGLDALVPYLDALAGNQDGPRAIGHSNKRGSKKGVSEAKPARDGLSEADIARIVEIYAADFERFGYTPDMRKPVAEKPALPQGYAEARDRDRAYRDRLDVKLGRKLGRWLDRA